MHIYIDLLETFCLFLIKKDRIQRVLINGTLQAA